MRLKVFQNVWMTLSSKNCFLTDGDFCPQRTLNYGNIGNFRNNGMSRSFFILMCIIVAFDIIQSINSTFGENSIFHNYIWHESMNRTRMYHGQYNTGILILVIGETSMHIKSWVAFVIVLEDMYLWDYKLFLKPQNMKFASEQSEIAPICSTAI